MTLQIADHPVTDAERHDVLMLLGAYAEQQSNTCDCFCDCYATSIGGGVCRQCAGDDHVWPEATR